MLFLVELVRALVAKELPGLQMAALRCIEGGEELGMVVRPDDVTIADFRPDRFDDGRHFLLLRVPVARGRVLQPLKHGFQRLQFVGAIMFQLVRLEREGALCTRRRCNGRIREQDGFRSMDHMGARNHVSEPHVLLVENGESTAPSGTSTRR